MNQRDKVNNNSKMGKRSKFRRNKVFLIILALLVVFLLVATTLAYYNGFFDNNDTNNVLVINTTNNSSNSSNVSLVTPKEGYSLITLAGLKFFVKDKYAKQYYNKDYFDGFYGGKNYDPNHNDSDDIHYGYANYSQLRTYDEINGSYKSFDIDITDVNAFNRADATDYKNKNTKQNITVENRKFNGNSFVIVHTGERFGSEDLYENSTIAIIEIKGKRICIVWEGYPFDMYVIESFFRLNY